MHFSNHKNDNLALFLAHKGTETITLLATILGLTALGYVVVNLYITATLPTGATVPAVVQMAVVLLLVRAGRLRAALTVFLWGLTLITLVSAMLGAGLTTPALLVLPVIVMASAWLFGKRESLLNLACVCAGLAVLGVLHAKGLVSPFQILSPMALAGAFIGINVAASILGLASSKSFKVQFLKSQNLSQDLSRQVEELTKAESKLRELVYHDETTGLRSAHAQRERVNALTQQQQPFALLCLKLDSFRLINDNFGPSFGNAIISAAAGVIAQAVGQSGELARADGPEFTVVTVNVVDQELLKDLSNRILISLRQPLNQGEVDIYSDISIGISRFPVDATDPDELFRMAQLALHKAKEMGGHGMCGYESYMNQAAQSNLWLDHNLRTAIDRQELALHYQPKMRLENNAFIGVEALLRWTHPDRGTIRPDEFIPRAEVTGSIIPVGRWVISTAAEQAAAWVAQGKRIRIAINLSAKQLTDNELLAHLQHAQTVAHGLLDIELTESCLADSEKATQTFTEECRALGYGVHLDDFGTGYSSLSRVAQLPLTKIKLDRGFVATIGQSQKGDALLRAMVSICKELDLPMIAEGVETEAQAHYLRSLGVAYAQGWLYGPAMAPAKLEQWLAQAHAIGAAHKYGALSSGSGI